MNTLIDEMVVIMITLIGIYYRTDDNNLFILFSLRHPIAGHTEPHHTKCHLNVCLCVCAREAEHYKL